MGFVSMRRNFGRHMRTVLYVVFVIFLVSCFYGLMSYVGGPARRQEAGAPSDVVAVVNGEKINRAVFEMAFQQQYFKDLVLALKMIVNSSQSCPGCFRDLAHGGAVETLLGKQGIGGT